MFNGLGSSLRFSGTRVNFEESVNWATEFLSREDRIIWYLGILQRASLLRKYRENKCSTRALRRKVSRMLVDYSPQRIYEDYSFEFRESWHHFKSVLEIYSDHQMQKYSFFLNQENKGVSKTPSQIISDFRKMECNLQNTLRGERHCNDGVPFITLKDGWVWFFVGEGRSRQEATAMRHCGNGLGRLGDQLLSLREPIKKGKLRLWRPHLTFILNNGYLGEMKGFANSKPKMKLHGRIVCLLQDERIHGIKGGGYQPKCNFSFSDLAYPLRQKVLEENNKLDFDPIGEDGESIEELGGGIAWSRVSKVNNRDFVQLMSPQIGKGKSQWVTLQSTFNLGHRSYKFSEAWSSDNGGHLGVLHFPKEHTNSDSVKVEALLKNKAFLSVEEDLLDSSSSWGRVLKKESVKNLLVARPDLFVNSPIEKIFEFSGCSYALSCVLNQRYGLNTKSSSHGIELQNFLSFIEFGQSSGVGWLVTLMEKSDISHKEFSEFDFLELGWLVLRRGIRGPCLYLLREGVIHFFKTMDLDNQAVGSNLLSEIVLRFGPPDRKRFTAELGLS